MLDCEGQDAEACWTDFKSSQNSTDLIASPGKTHGVTFRQRHVSTATTSRLGQELVGLSTSAGTTSINTLWNTVVQTQQLPKKWKCHSKPMWERHISPCCRFPWRFGRKQSRRKATKVHLSYKKLSSHATTAGTVWAAGTIDVPLTSAYCSSWMLSWDSAGAETLRRSSTQGSPSSPRPNVCLGIPLLLDERDRRYLSSQAKLIDCTTGQCPIYAWLAQASSQPSNIVKQCKTRKEQTSIQDMEKQQRSLVCRLVPLALWQLRQSSTSQISTDFAQSQRHLKAHHEVLLLVSCDHVTCRSILTLVET